MYSLADDRKWVICDRFPSQCWGVFCYFNNILHSYTGSVYSPLHWVTIQWTLQFKLKRSVGVKGLNHLLLDNQINPFFMLQSPEKQKTVCFKKYIFLISDYMPLSMIDGFNIQNVHNIRKRLLGVFHGSIIA